LEDQTSSSSHELLVHNISDLGESHVDNEMHLPEDISTILIINVKEDKGLVSNDPFQLFEFNDQTLDDLDQCLKY
jgi:hypothetical protein